MVDKVFFRYPFYRLCKKCGKLYLCDCFRGFVDNPQAIFRKSICHMCTGKVPTDYPAIIYVSSFLQSYYPYFKLFQLKNPNLSKKEVEDLVREKFGYPKIGERWVSETELFKIIELIFPYSKIIRHYRGKELEGLELDVFIPEYNLGIEYQGEQHFEAIEHWGGKEGLLQRQKRDKKKKKLCNQIGYKLIEFIYSEELTVEKVEKKLSKYIGKKR